MSRFISASQYKLLTQIPRSRFATHIQIYCGTIVEKDDRILMVKSQDEKYGGWDLPGGKLLWSEDVFSCAVREVLEEGRYKIKLENALGIYQRKAGPEEKDYLRIIFTGTLESYYKRRKGGLDIADARWFQIDNILQNQVKLRSTEVLREISDYKKGISYPLEIIKMYTW